MRVIVGLGNPGSKYSDTRHNIGYKVVENLAYKRKLNFNKVSTKYLLAKGKVNNFEFSLLLPLTYMNLSGEAVKEFYSKYNFLLSEMLVVCDDINLSVGKIRLRSKGSHGGHNGLLSIIEALQSTNFPRLRIGIGNNFEKEKQAEYVLSSFNEEEKPFINESIEKATLICDTFLEGGIKAALETYSKIQSVKKSNPTNKGVIK